MQARISDLNGVGEIHLLVLVPALRRFLKDALDKGSDVFRARVIVWSGLGYGYQEVVAKV